MSQNRLRPDRPVSRYLAPIAQSRIRGRVLAITKPRHIPYEYMTLAVAAGRIQSRPAQDRAIEQGEYFIENHLAGLLAVLQSDELTEPALAVLLELLYPAGVLTSEVLDPLLSQWKQRFFVKPDTYTPAAPAVVTLVVACTRAGHPKAAEILRTVMNDTQKWSEPHRYLLRDGLDWGETGDLQALDELSEVANSGSSKTRLTARHGMRLPR